MATVIAHGKVCFALTLLKYAGHPIIISLSKGRIVKCLISEISFKISNVILVSFCLCNRKEQRWVVNSFLCHDLLILWGYLICSHAGGFVTSLSLSLKQIRKLIGKRGDPFYEAQENHNLIGVANVFLECLFYDVKLQYAVPIISQQGEVGLGWGSLCSLCAPGV